MKVLVLADPSALDAEEMGQLSDELTALGLEPTGITPEGDLRSSLALLLVSEGVYHHSSWWNSVEAHATDVVAGWLRMPRFPEREERKGKPDAVGQ